MLTSTIHRSKFIWKLKTFVKYLLDFRFYIELLHVIQYHCHWLTRSITAQALDTIARASTTTPVSCHHGTSAVTLYTWVFWCTATVNDTCCSSWHDSQHIKQYGKPSYKTKNIYPEVLSKNWFAIHGILLLHVTLLFREVLGRFPLQNLIIKCILATNWMVYWQ